MKYSKIRMSQILSLGLFLAAGCNAPQAGNSTNPPPASIDGPTTDVRSSSTVGGISSGGGELTVAQPASYQNLKDNAESAIGFRFQLKRVLYHAEADYNTYVLTKINVTPDALEKNYSGKAFEKLFGPNRTADIYKVLDQIQFHVQEHGPCYNSDHEERDASIYGYGPYGVCLSAERIGPRTEYTSMQWVLTALAAHELSHYLGTDEDEAVEIQKEVLNNTVFLMNASPGTIELTPLVDWYMGQINYLGAVSNSLEEVKTAINQIPVGSLGCDSYSGGPVQKAIYKLSAAISATNIPNMQEPYEGTGAAVHSALSASKILAANNSVIEMMKYCYSDTDAPDRQQILQNFNGQTQEFIDLYQISSDLHDGYRVPTITPEYLNFMSTRYPNRPMLRYVPYGDETAFRASFKETEQWIDDVLEEMTSTSY